MVVSQFLIRGHTFCSEN